MPISTRWLGWFTAPLGGVLLAGGLLVWSAPLHAQVQPPPQATAAGTFRIAGTVVNAMNGTPLGKARVSLSDVRSRSQALFVISSEDGHFEFTALPAGKFSLQGAKNGFLPGTYEQHGTLSTAIVTGAGLETEHLTLRIIPRATLFGSIFDESGEPVRGAWVTLYSQQNRQGFHRIEFAGRVVTDDQGSYEFAGQDPGTYFVCVTAKPWYAVHPPSPRQNTTSTFAMVVDASLDVAYPATLFNGATDSDAATPILLKGGEHRQADIQVGPVPSLRVVVHLPSRENTSSFAMPIFERRIFEFMDFVQPESSETLDTNIMELTGIPAGKYTMALRGSGSSASESSAEVNLRSGLEEIDGSKTVSMASVKVALKSPDAAPRPAQLWVGLQDTRARFVAGGQVDASGEITLDSVSPGKYTLTIAAEEGEYAILRVLSGGQEMDSPQINVAAGANLDVMAFFTRGSASVEGLVKSGGKPTPGVMVVAVPKDPQSHPDSFRRDQSDFDGSFVVRDVLPGVYTLIALEDGWDLEWREPGALKKYLARGQTLTISGSMQGVVRLQQDLEAMK